MMQGADAAGGYGPGFPVIRGEGMRGALGKRYFPDDDLIAAVNVALACGRPLLLTGEAGCGKTDFAFAVAGQLAAAAGAGGEHSLLECYVRSDSRAADLLYHYDAVRRFSDAQLRASARVAVQVPDDHPGEYIRLEPLGRAIISEHRRVVLIDEIDKAPRDLPNDLLRPLDKHSFDVPEIPPGMTWAPAPGDPRHALATVMGPPRSRERPLVIITSNEERQLPDPFLRRCVFYHIQFPDRDRLFEILGDQFGKDTDQTLRGRILRVFLELRREGTSLTKRATTSELIDWTHALTRVFARQSVVARLGAFCEAIDRAGEDRDLAGLPWGDVPGLSCLVKLREDLARLGLAAAG